MAKDAGLVKRQQIAKANRTMFIWIVAASVVVGAAAVSSIFMVRKALFNNKVLTAQNKTIDTLRKNNESIKKLADDVRVLDTDPALASAKAYPDEQTIRVLSDAIPDTDDASALGASIQKIIAGVKGIDLDSLSFPGLNSSQVAAVPDEAGVLPEGASPMAFQMKLVAKRTSDSSATAKLDKVLLDMERSIRVLNVRHSKLEINGSTASLTISGEAYYALPVNADLTEEPVSP